MKAAKLRAVAAVGNAQTRLVEAFESLAAYEAPFIEEADEQLRLALHAIGEARNCLRQATREREEALAERAAS